MKKPVILFGLLMAGGLAFTSCTKHLKDDVSDLKKEIDSLNKSNAELEGQVGGIEVMLGANEPITATTTFTGDNNVAITVKDTYRFKAANSSTQWAAGRSDGSYHFYIERFSDVEWYEGARVEFIYNPNTKEVTQKKIRHYWDTLSNYNDYADYGELEPTNAGLQINITVNSFNPATGEISLNATANADANYAGLSEYYAPNPGKPYSTSLAYAGKVKVYPYVAP